MISKKEVSIIIVTFGRINVVIDLLNDLLTQTFNNFEVIVVSDGCMSSFDKKVREFNNFFQLISLDTGLKNKYGLGLARNLGLKNANGSYCIILDDDCRISNTFIEEHFNNAERKTIVGGRRFSLGKNSEILQNKMNILRNIPIKKSIAVKKIIKDYKNISLIENNISFYKKDIDNLGYFFEVIKLYGLIGQEFFYRASIFDLKYKYVEEAAIEHLTNAQEVITNKKNKKLTIAILNNIFILPLIRNKFFALLQKRFIHKTNKFNKFLSKLIIFVLAFILCPFIIFKRLFFRLLKYI